MHIAYIHQHFSTRGGDTGTRSYEMSRRLLARGHRVTMICGAYEQARQQLDPDKPVTEMHIDGIRVLAVNQPYANRMGFRERVTAFWRFAKAAEQLVKRTDADLVFATSTPLTVGIPGMRGAKALKVPFVFEVRDLWPDIPIAMGALRNPVLKWYTRWLERRIYMAAKHIIALSPGMKEGIARRGYPPDRITMIPNASDTDLFRPDGGIPLGDRFGEPDAFRLVFTGAHGKANGLDAVLDAAGELKQRGVRGVVFVFIGGGGEKPRLVQRSRDEGLGELVRWIDPIPKRELARVLPSMHVGMMILRNLPDFYYGTSPNKFFDYIAAGLPVLNNYPGWLEGLIKQHDIGLVVPPDDPIAFADAVLALRERAAELPQMGARARRLAETEFDRDLLAGRFVDTLERAVGA